MRDGIQAVERVIKIVVKWVADYDGDTSWLGKYSDKPGAWTVDRKRGILYGDAHWFVKNVRGANKAQAMADRYEELGYEVELTSPTERADGYKRAWQVYVSGYKPLRTDLSTRYDRNEYRYFHPPVENYEGIPEQEKAGYCVQDYERMTEYNMGSWSFMGCVATLTLNGEEIGHSSVWGVESDSDKSYFAEVERDEIWGAHKTANDWLASVGAPALPPLDAIPVERKGDVEYS